MKKNLTNVFIWESCIYSTKRSLSKQFLMVIFELFLRIKWLFCPALFWQNMIWKFWGVIFWHKMIIFQVMKFQDIKVMAIFGCLKLVIIGIFDAKITKILIWALQNFSKMKFSFFSNFYGVNLIKVAILDPNI